MASVMRRSCLVFVLRERGGDFEGVVGAAGVAAGVGGDLFQRAIVGCEVEVAEAALGVFERSLQQGDNLLLGERLQNVNAAAREQRGDDFERRVLGGGADQADAALLDVGQERVLLGFVEAVHFVDEDDGARAVLPRAFGLGHDLLDFLDAAHHGRELDELGVGHAGDDLGQRGLADAGRAPEDERAGVVALDLHAKGFAGAENVLLPDELVERAGAHALGKRAGAVGFVAGWESLEETHGI